MATIRMTPQELRNSANFLNNKKDSIINEVAEIQRNIDATTAEWEGAAQSSFVESFNQMLPMLQKDFPQVIEGIAAQLNGAADALENADEEVAKAFK